MRDRKLLIFRGTFEKLTNFTRENSGIENGGLIFGRQNPKWIQIMDVSDAGPHSIRNKFGVQFDGSYLSKYTIDRIRENIFVLGTWHSHPTGYNLNPSHVDIKTMLSLMENFESPFYPIFCITKWENKSLEVSFYSIDSQSNIRSVHDITVLEEE